MRSGKVSSVVFATAFCAACNISLVPTALSQAQQNFSAPIQASSVGYSVNTFHSTFQNDVENLNSTGTVNWYMRKWGSWPATRRETIRGPNGPGITISDGGDTGNYTLGSATDEKSPAPRNWSGTAFGGGGYFEAEISFDSTPIMAPGAVGFPAWWLEPIEHFVYPRLAVWAGQAPGYEHFVELDIFEYNQWKRGQNVYSGAVHEWYGIYRQTCPPNFCRVSNTNDTSNFDNFLITVPPATDFKQFHKYGLLWVPATPVSSGYVQYFFDGTATADRVTWSQFTNQAPPPGKAPWTFGVTDLMHYVLILGTGNNQPMTVRSVNVWQASASNNLHQ